MAHTVKVILAGFALLALCLLVGRFMSSAPAAGLVLASKVFVALWLVASAVNLWIGVSRAGYSVAEELPIFFVVFLIPAAAAAVVWWKASQG